MNVKVKRIDKELELPEYKTKGSVGFDLLAREKVVVKPFVVTLIPLNLIVKVPLGYGLLLYSRSSTPAKKGLIVANSVGIIDQDYSGENDELKLAVLNFTKKNVVVDKGERICQAVFTKVITPKLTEVKKMTKKSRGGFGSTG